MIEHGAVEWGKEKFESQLIKVIEGNRKAYDSFVLKMCHPNNREQLIFNDLKNQYKLKANGVEFVIQLDHIIQKVHSLIGENTNNISKSIASRF